MADRPAPAWYVISLRPAGQHAALRSAAARRGAGFIALSPWRLQVNDDGDTRAQLAEALRADCVIFTSPFAVKAAAALLPLQGRDRIAWYAVGAGTAAALRRAGVDTAQHPARMDSEGLLDMPGLRALHGRRVALVTAPGGRGVLLPALRARGAEVIRADVYARVPITPPATAVTALRALRAPAVLTLSSGEALHRILDALPHDAVAILRRASVVAASRRLADAARGHGFDDIVIAEGPRPSQLVAAAGIRAGNPYPQGFR
jgi:uroporphyrinogen-III synthase